RRVLGDPGRRVPRAGDPGGDPPMCAPVPHLVAGPCRRRPSLGPARVHSIVVPRPDPDGAAAAGRLSSRAKEDERMTSPSATDAERLRFPIGPLATDREVTAE